MGSIDRPYLNQKTIAPGVVLDIDKYADGAEEDDHESDEEDRYRPSSPITVLPCKRIRTKLLVDNGGTTAFGAQEIFFGPSISDSQLSWLQSLRRSELKHQDAIRRAQERTGDYSGFPDLLPETEEAAEAQPEAYSKDDPANKKEKSRRVRIDPSDTEAIEELEALFPDALQTEDEPEEEEYHSGKSDDESSDSDYETDDLSDNGAEHDTIDAEEAALTGFKPGVVDKKAAARFKLINQQKIFLDQHTSEMQEANQFWARRDRLLDQRQPEVER